MALNAFDLFCFTGSGTSVTVTNNAFFAPLSDCLATAAVAQFFSIDDGAFTASFVSFTTRGADGSDSPTILPISGPFGGTSPAAFIGSNVDSVLMSLNVTNSGDWLGDGITTASANFILTTF